MAVAAVSPYYTSALSDPRKALQSFRGHEVAVYGKQSRLEVTASSTHQDFQAHHIVAAAASPAPPARRVVPFEGHTSYSQDFVRHQISSPQLISLPPPKAHCPFEGSSLYKDNFKTPKLPPPPPAFNPIPRVAVPFQGSSTTHSTFVQHPVQLAPTSPTPPPRQKLPFQGCSSTHESYRGHAVTPRCPSVGIATMGDRFHVLIPASAPAPTSGSQVFTTVHDGQDEVCFLVYQGDAALASQNQLLGQFQLGPLPPAPAGSFKIQVTFYLDQDGCLSAEAQDTESGQQYQWRLQRN